MRTLSPAALAALQRSPLPVVILVEMDLTLPLYLNTSSLDLTLNGKTYLGTRGLGKIDTVQDSPAEIKPLMFEISGTGSANIALVRVERVQGKPVRILRSIFDPDTYQVLDVRLRWAGRLDVLAIEDGPGTSTLSVTAEHAGIDLLRPFNSLYSDAEQRRLYPGDPSLQYIADQVEMRIVWPDKSWKPA